MKLIYNIDINTIVVMGAVVQKAYKKKICVDQSQFQNIKDKLCLDDENIQDIYQCFRKFDRFDRAYIDFDDFIVYFRGQIHNFVELPFAQRLFKCIPKVQESKVFFEQFVEGISAFCLLNNQSLLHFIFDYIDVDGDQRISKQDIMKLIKYTDPQNGKQTFFTNFSSDLIKFPMKQNQNKMDFDHFRLNSDKLMFLIWPAFSLQEYLRESILGSKFWLSLYSKVQKKQIEIKNNEKKQLRIKQKLQILKNIKIKRIESLLFKDSINDRKPAQPADDSKLLKRSKKARRRSAIYIKEQLQINNGESENNEK